MTSAPIDTGVDCVGMHERCSDTYDAKKRRGTTNEFWSKMLSDRMLQTTVTCVVETVTLTSQVVLTSRLL